MLGLLSVLVYAQDTLIYKTGKEIAVKLIEVNPTEIRYKRQDNLNGPVYTALRKDFFMVKYAKGGTEILNRVYDNNETQNMQAVIKRTLELSKRKRSAGIGLTVTGSAIFVGGMVAGLATLTEYYPNNRISYQSGPGGYILSAALPVGVVLLIPGAILLNKSFKLRNEAKELESNLTFTKETISYSLKF
jgi:hypothetical protein